MSRALVSRLRGKVLLPAAPILVQRSWIHQRQQQAPRRDELLERLERCKLACKKLWMTSLDTVLSSSKSFVGSNSNRSKVLASTGTLLALQVLTIFHFFLIRLSHGIELLIDSLNFYIDS
ncbi:hypothetical protein TSAR_016721 [Trichomalopsis sarcophagae]|uniref:Uncharacterized protein n=1 Tax=Trichomalopsis sarcophagae TaxID=543379 RepID=A0A232EQE0_9HYME|nr:hypothetical protein TSAR_016721 [Trichomalopsis sarcophagae]